MEGVAVGGIGVWEMEMAYAAMGEIGVWEAG